MRSPIFYTNLSQVQKEYPQRPFGSLPLPSRPPIPSNRPLKNHIAKGLSSPTQSWSESLRSFLKQPVKMYTLARCACPSETDCSAKNIWLCSPEPAAVPFRSDPKQLLQRHRGSINSCSYRHLLYYDKMIQRKSLHDVCRINEFKMNPIDFAPSKWNRAVSACSISLGPTDKIWPCYKMLSLLP